MTKHLRLCLAFAFALGWHVPGAAQAEEPAPVCESACCNSEESLEKATSWAEIAKWYRDFSMCDDGDNAEGLDSGITHKLATEWPSAAEKKSK